MVQASQLAGTGPDEREPPDSASPFAPLRCASVALKDWRQTSVRTMPGVERQWAARRQVANVGQLLRQVRRSPAWEHFNGSADRLAGAVGSWWAVMGTALLAVVWVTTGPILQLSDEGQLFVNTTTTVLTFGSVLAIQSKRQPRSQRDMAQAAAHPASDSPNTL